MNDVLGPEVDVGRRRQVPILVACGSALAAVAGAFGVRRSAVRLVSGAASRTKIIDIDAGDPQVLTALLAAPARS
jgi:uncharacterized protein YggU (UPF0235/DUF167 family)